MTVVAGVELGGTKCICVLGTADGEIRAQVEVPTTQPEETLGRIEAVSSGWTFAAVGIASFGPLDLDPASPRFGAIVNTPKTGWSGTDLKRLAGGRPFAIDTDVNGAALAEGHWGGARDLASWAYVTVGTGIGVGSIVAHAPLRGLGHCEAGHMRIPHPPTDGFPGLCPFHGDCVEGMASGPAIEARAGLPGRNVPPDHPAWGFAADALAALCHNLVLGSLPQRIFLGGGVAIGQPQLLPLVRERLVVSLAGYGTTGGIAPVEDYVALPQLGSRAGPLGTLALARRALT